MKSSSESIDTKNIKDLVVVYTDQADIADIKKIVKIDDIFYFFPSEILWFPPPYNGCFCAFAFKHDDEEANQPMIFEYKDGEKENVVVRPVDIPELANVIEKLAKQNHELRELKLDVELYESTKEFIEEAERLAKA